MNKIQNQKGVASATDKNREKQQTLATDLVEILFSKEDIEESSAESVELEYTPEEIAENVADEIDVKLNITNLSNQEILDYLHYRRNWLVLPSNTKKNFEEMFELDLSGQKWHKFIKQITFEWNYNGDECFINDFMELLVCSRRIGSFMDCR